MKERVLMSEGFFFSSRRRHTRWTGDWSSDVCSSDLADLSEQERRAAYRRQGKPVQEAGVDIAREVGARYPGGEQRALQERERQEEREKRVGRKARQMRRGAQAVGVHRHQ